MWWGEPGLVYTLVPEPTCYVCGLSQSQWPILSAIGTSQNVPGLGCKKMRHGSVLGGGQQVFWVLRGLSQCHNDRNVRQLTISGRPGESYYQLVV